MQPRIVVLVIGLGLACALYVTLPAKGVVLAVASTANAPIRGAIHIHTKRSDGTGTVDEVAAAAARAGLAFVILTDHGDATRRPDVSAYLHGVLVVDAVEISTSAGHLVALGLPQAPYPFGGEPRDVVEDVKRLGGMAIAAHPGSAKPELRWPDWSAPIDGLEWLNGDSEWRDESLAGLALALLRYPFRQVETIGALLDRPVAVLKQWDTLTRTRKVVAVASADAHARLGLRGAGDPYDSAATLEMPAYEQVFRTFSIALTQARLTGDAVADGRTVIEEIRRGHLYSSLDVFAHPALLTFSARSGRTEVGQGDTIAPTGPLTLSVETNASPDSTITLFRDGAAVTTSRDSRLEHVAPPEPAVYRVEVQLAGAPGRPPAPWLVSNPIYVGPRAAGIESSNAAKNASAVRWNGGSITGWTVEHSVRSLGAVDAISAADGSQLLFRYALGGLVSDGQYAALVMPAGPTLAGSNRIIFSVRADRPMRLDLQARVASAPAGERWHRSVYVDQTSRQMTVAFDDMRPIGVTSVPTVPVSSVDAFLFVIDTVNAKPGANGQVWLDDVAYGK